MNIDYTKLKEISDDLVTKMLEKHPDANWTIWMNLWMDDTFQVICRSAKPLGDNKFLVRDLKWYDGEITYTEKENDHG